MTARRLPAFEATLIAWFCVVVSQNHSSAQDRNAARFEESVTAAVQRGVSFLYATVGEGWEPIRFPQGDYPQGIRALTAYALLEAGTAPAAAVIQRLFAEMEKLPLRRVYSVSLYVMALDAWIRRGGEARAMEARQQSLARGLEWLAEARLLRRGVWGYERMGSGPGAEYGMWVDFSNTQFAVLALKVGLRNELDIPAVVWDEIVSSHLTSSRVVSEPRVRLRCEGPGWWLASRVESGGSSLEFTARGFALAGSPRGWAYRPVFRGGGREAGRTSYSMTAGAVSSLIVAREGLARAQTLDEKRRRTIDGAIAEGVLTLRRDWASLHPGELDNLLRNYYYTLYSFEKAMDLGGIVTFGGIDWYRHQARVLIAEQRSDGAWGGSRAGADSHYDQVSTAFALLFLCRASRNLRVDPPEPIITAAGAGGPARGVNAGRVYLGSQGGVVSVTELYALLADLRTPDLLEAAREVARTIAPEALPELLPHLHPLTAGNDAVAKYARAKIEDIAGLSGRASREEIEVWVSTWRAVRSWGRARDASRLPDLVEILGDAEASAVLKVTAIEAVLKIGSLDAVPVLISLLEAKRARVRERAHDALEILTLKSMPFDAGASAAKLRRVSIAWREFWELHGERLRFRYAWQRLRTALEGAETIEERARVRDEIIGLGSVALPEVEAILAGDDYAFDWVLIREGITGERQGF